LTPSPILEPVVTWQPDGPDLPSDASGASNPSFPSDSSCWRSSVPRG